MMIDFLMIGFAFLIIVVTGVITWAGNDPEDDGVTSQGENL